MPKRQRHSIKSMSSEDLIKTLNTIKPLMPLGSGVDDDDDVDANEYKEARDDLFKKINQMSDEDRLKTLIRMMKLTEIRDHQAFNMWDDELDTFISGYYTIFKSEEQNALCILDKKNRLPIWHAIKRSLTKTIAAMNATGAIPTANASIIVQYTKENNSPITLSQALFVLNKFELQPYTITCLGAVVLPYLNQEDLNLFTSFILTDCRFCGMDSALSKLVAATQELIPSRPIYRQFISELYPKLRERLNNYEKWPEILKTEIEAYKMLYLSSEPASDEQKKYHDAYLKAVDQYTGLGTELMVLPFHLGTHQLPPETSQRVQNVVRNAASTCQPILPALFSIFQPPHKVDAATQTDIHTEVNHDIGSANQTVAKICGVDTYFQ